MGREVDGVDEVAVAVPLPAGGGVRLPRDSFGRRAVGRKTGTTVTIRRNSVQFNSIQFNSKNVIIPQEAILLWSRRARKIIIHKLRGQYN